jgi:hypothetical protein
VHVRGVALLMQEGRIHRAQTVSVLLSHLVLFVESPRAG